MNLTVVNLDDLNEMFQKVVSAAEPRTPDIMNMKQVCKYTTLSESSIRNLMKTDDFPASKVGGVYLFRKIDVDIYLDKKRIGL